MLRCVLSSLNMGMIYCIEAYMHFLHFIYNRDDDADADDDADDDDDDDDDDDVDD